MRSQKLISGLSEGCHIVLMRSLHYNHFNPNQPYAIVINTIINGDTHCNDETCREEHLTSLILLERNENILHFGNDSHREEQSHSAQPPLSDKSRESSTPS